MKNNITLLLVFICCGVYGQSWKKLPFDQTTHQDNYNDLYFHSETNGHMVGDNWSYLKTFDAGKTWIKKDISSLSDRVFTRVIFLDDSVGFIQGVGRFYKTLNGGNSWTTINLGVYRNQIGISNGQVFAYGDSGFGGLYFSRYFPANDSFHTQNGAWSMYDLTNLEYVGDSILYLSKDSGNIYKSTDFGQTLTLSFSDSTIKSRVKDIHFISKDTGYVIYENSAYLYTTDGGTSWAKNTTLVSLFYPKILTRMTKWIDKLYFVASVNSNFVNHSYIYYFNNDSAILDTGFDTWLTPSTIYIGASKETLYVGEIFWLEDTASEYSFGFLVKSIKTINVQKLNPLHLKIYPNPSSGKFTIELPQLDTKNLSIETVNTLGQRTSSNYTFTGKHLSLEIKESGIHFIQVYDDNVLIYTGKLIVE